MVEKGNKRREQKRDGEKRKTRAMEVGEEKGMARRRKRKMESGGV